MRFLPTCSVFMDIPVRAGATAAKSCARPLPAPARPAAKHAAPSKPSGRPPSKPLFAGIGASAGAKVPVSPKPKAAKPQQLFQGIGGKLGGCDAVLPPVAQIPAAPTKADIDAGWDAAFARARNPFAQVSNPSLTAVDASWDASFARVWGWRMRRERQP